MSKLSIVSELLTSAIHEDVLIGITIIEDMSQDEYKEDFLGKEILTSNTGLILGGMNLNTGNKTICWRREYESNNMYLAVSFNSPTISPRRDTAYTPEELQTHIRYIAPFKKSK